jgi:DNA polymerase-4
MAPLKVSYVPGVGRVRQKILLEELNILLVRELAMLDMGSMKLIFGRRAFVIQQRALGIDPTPVYPAPAKPMVSEEITLPEDENDDRLLLGVLYALVEKCGRRMRKRALFPKRAGLLIRYSDQMEAKRQIKMPRLSHWDFDIYGPLQTLFFKVCRRRVRVRFMQIRFWDFSYDSGQLSLFHAPAPAEEKQASVVQALDRIRARHGEAAIKHGKAA